MNLVPSPFNITSCFVNYPGDASVTYQPVIFYTDQTSAIVSGFLANDSNPSVLWPLYPMGRQGPVSNLMISTPLGQFQVFFSPGDGSTNPTTVILQDLTSSKPQIYNERVLWTAPTVSPAVASGSFTLLIDASRWAAGGLGIALKSN